MKVEKILEVITAHNIWLRGDSKGSRANLEGADLTGADLTGADLTGANLTRANLTGANLARANLTRANLTGANLTDANLTGANLTDADLTRADLADANLTRADLADANLTDAKNKDLVFSKLIVPAEGSIIVWKKAKASSGTCIVKLGIPQNARRSNATGRKCRAEWAEVIDVIGADYGISYYNESIVYRKGEIVRPDKWDESRWNECSNGIHFFITREEAESWQF